jgi:hypothetical protein
MSNSLVPAGQIRNLPAVQREQAVTTYLATARDRLADALTATGPESVAAIKAEVSTVAEMTKQLGLSKECRDDATEMVRRAEYALGKAIRKGQEEGTVTKHGETLIPGGPREGLEVDQPDFQHKKRVTDIASRAELYGTRGDGVMALTEADDEQFEEALTEAKAEGNLSRANVVRHVKGQKGSEPTASQRVDEIADLADQGYTSRQIAKRLGIGTEYLGRIRRQHDIDIPADKLLGKTRRHDSTRIVNETVLSLAGLTTALELIDYDDLDPAEAAEWAASLSESFRVFNRFYRKIKETAHV